MPWQPAGSFPHCTCSRMEGSNRGRRTCWRGKKGWWREQWGKGRDSDQTAGWKTLRTLVVDTEKDIC